MANEGDSCAPGNAAAMREALKLALDALISWLNGTIDRTTNRKTIKAIRAALSSPARNCDRRFADAEAARQAWLDDADNWDEFGSPRLELHEWLFAPMTGRKP